MGNWDELIMNKENMAIYIMNKINDATDGKNFGVVYREYTIQDREDGDELVCISDVRLSYKDYDYTYSMENEAFKPNNVDEIIQRHLPAIKEWMSKYVEPTN